MHPRGPDDASHRRLWLHTTSPKTEAECSSQTYFAAFRRVMAAALTAKGPIDTADVSLSLQWHSHVTIEIISALHNALQSATRPLRRLSLAHINIDGAHAAKQLGCLLFSPPRAVSNGSLINISSLDFMKRWCRRPSMVDQVLVGVAEHVQETVARSRRDGVRVECQCFALDVFDGNALTEMLPTKLDPERFYAVVSATDDGKIGLEIPSDSRGLIGWVSVEAVSGVRTAKGRCLVRCNFTSVVADRYSPLFAPLIRVVGRNLQRLVLRMRASQELFRLMEGCVNLQQLATSKPRHVYEGEYPVEDCCLATLPSSLQMLSCSGGRSKLRDIRSLAKLANLRYLVLRGNGTVVTAEDLTSLLHVVETAPRLQQVEVDLLKSTCKSLKLQLDAYRREDTSVGTKTAFLSVLSQLGQWNPERSPIPEETIVSILQFAGGMSWPVVNWC